MGQCCEPKMICPPVHTHSESINQNNINNYNLVIIHEEKENGSACFVLVLIFFYLDDIGELAQHIRNISLNLIKRHVLFETRSEIVLANVERVQSLGEIVVHGQQFFINPSCCQSKIYSKD